jgi:hypothetical protein
LIIKHLFSDGVVDAFVLWNELTIDPYSYYRHHSNVLIKELPKKPFSKPLSPVGYRNIFRLAKPEITRPEHMRHGSSCMGTIIPFVCLYEMLTSADDQLLSPDDAGLLHKALGNGILMEAIRGDLNSGLNRNDIETMLSSPITSLGLKA